MNSIHPRRFLYDSGCRGTGNYGKQLASALVWQGAQFVAVQDDALLIVSIAKRAVEVSGDMRRPGVHGKVAGLIKDKVEQGLGLGGWQCIVGQKGTFGCYLSPAPHNYFNFDLATVTVLMFKAT